MSKYNKPLQAGADKAKHVLIVSDESGFEKNLAAYKKLGEQGFGRLGIVLRPDNSKPGPIAQAAIDRADYIHED